MASPLYMMVLVPRWEERQTSISRENVEAHEASLLLTLPEAARNALTFLESHGFKGGDVHDDLARALGREARR